MCIGIFILPNQNTICIRDISCNRISYACRNHNECRTTYLSVFWINRSPNTPTDVSLAARAYSLFSPTKVAWPLELTVTLLPESLLQVPEIVEKFPLARAFISTVDVVFDEVELPLLAFATLEEDWFADGWTGADDVDSLAVWVLLSDLELLALAVLFFVVLADFAFLELLLFVVFVVFTECPLSHFWLHFYDKHQVETRNITWLHLPIYMIFSLYFLSFSGILKFQSHYTTLFCKNQHILEIFVIYL